MEKQKDYYQIEKVIQKYKGEIDKLQEKEDVDKERIEHLRESIQQQWEKIKPKLRSVHFVQIARHPDRPYTLDYVNTLTDDFLEFHGDRRSGDDPAIVAGFALYRGRTAAIIGHQKGRKTRERIQRNFGQPNPEGFRKALRIMNLAEKYGYPVITFIDTPGAYPGLEAEERGQAEAIAYNLKQISKLNVPIVNIVIGEGGSGGALGIGVGDVLLMLENSFYSVISPEGCAAILWKDQSAVAQAAENLRFLPQDLIEFGVADKIIKEPPGGAHIDWMNTFRNVNQELDRSLTKLETMSAEERLDKRYQKYRKIGFFGEKK
ncbi:MAG: acetyl-CoA carboxylase carboxyltransferase subunit alpha [Acidobacteriota bacterium]